jgi:serine/threonine-protein kinase
VETRSSPPGSDAADGSLPERIGTYRVLKRLATGGTSDVLLGKAEGPRGAEQTVVLKLLLQEFREDLQFEKMFATEAAAYSRLSHPAIVKLYDFFSDGDQLVMVLEYVDGMPLHRLRALLKRGKFLDDSAAMYVAWRIFGALSAAHTARDPKTGELSPVIHRDVNPSNVLIPWDGQAKIADFGIAKVTGVDNDKTAAGFIKGTYGYMAPEQVRGENVTDRADVYAACLVLWELLVGRKAIVRGGTSDLDVLRAMAEPAFPALSALRPELPLEVLDMVERGLQPDPAKRTITAEELAAALRISCNLEDGRQRLVDALGGVRPPARHDDLAVTVSRAPRPPVEASADSTVPNLPALADDSQSLPPLPPLAVTPAPLPPAPVTAAKATVSLGIPQSLTPRPAPTPPPPPPAKTSRIAAPTLMGISPGRPAAPPTPGPIITDKPATPIPSVVVAQTPRPTAPLTPPPPPPAASVPPVHVPTIQASFVVSPFASTASMPARTPPPPPAPPTAAMPAAWTPPAPAPLPVVWTPPPPPPPTPPAAAAQITFTDETRRQRSVGRIVGAVAGVLALLVAILVIAWERGRSPSAYVPPGPDMPSARASASPAAPAIASAAPAPAPSPAPPAATVAPSPVAATPAGTTGTITVAPSQSGHRVWVDKHIVGESPGTFTVRCGWRSVQVGSQGYKHNVNVPCGGDLVVH